MRYSFWECIAMNSTALFERVKPYPNIVYIYMNQTTA